MRFFAALITLLLMLSSPVVAQDDDKGFIARVLEENLAGDGRTVLINGFSGALSKRATVASIIILDDEGEWLRMDNLALQLNRRALLGGRVEIEELSAEVINFSRLPVTPESDLPPAEAQGFSLPDLPVSIDIKLLKADSIILGEPILGEAAELTLTAAMSLINGEALVKLSAKRTDGKRGAFEIDAGFVGDEQAVDLNIRLDEGEGGIAARVLGLPSNPSTKLAILGSGTLNDLTTDITIATDGQDRLTGVIKLAANAPAAEGATVSRSFNADVSGDVTALFAPQYRPFFGENISLIVDGERSAEGALDISTLNLKTEALTLNGDVTLNRDYWPTKLDIRGRIANVSKTAITLPISGDATTVREAVLDVKFDSTQGNSWVGNFEVTDLVQSGVSIEKTNLQATGTLDGKVNAIGAVTADLNLDIAGIALDDPALMRAVGDQLNGTLNIKFTEGQPIEFDDLNVSGTDFLLTGDVKVEDLAGGLNTTFDTRLTASDISRFSDLAGNALNGSVAVNVAGSANLGGAFDIALNGDIDGLKMGQEQADALLRGKTKIVLNADRNSAGTRLKNLSILNEQLAFDGDAFLTSDGASLNFKSTLNDTSMLAEFLDGPASVAGSAIQRDGEWSLDIDATGPFNSSATIDGLATGPNARVSFTTNIPEIAAITPNYRGRTMVSGEAFVTPDGWNADTKITGPYGLNAKVAGLLTGPKARVSFDAALPDVSPFAPGYKGAAAIGGIAFVSPEGWNIDATGTGPYGLTADVKGRVTGVAAPSVSFSADLPNVGLLVPKISGPLRLAGDVKQVSDVRWDLAVDLLGPAGTSAVVSGAVSPSGRLDVSINGNAPLALANPFISPRSISGDTRFELRVNGPPNLSSVSGTLQTSNAQLVVPNYNISLQGIGADISLSSGRANVDMNAKVSSGGSLQISGPIGLTGLMPANLRIALNNVVVEDPSLYRTTLDGAIGVNGSLLSSARISGLLDVGETLISIPSSGISSFGTIPNITHVNAPSAVQRTRAKAGLVNSGGSPSGSKANYPLDVTINAPQQIFVRGRGLDAELGGKLRLTGSTANIISAGRFELRRGRLDILSKRFDLDEGVIQLQGDFDPFLRFVATTNTNSGTASVIVEGSASDPEVRFESSPESPQDEVLAQIFFGRDVSQISALQALQLASAVATLAGKGGEGIVSKLRRGFNLDDLDITTDEEGNAGLRAGKYISDNIYTDVTVGTQNNAEVSLNIDLTPTIKATGKLGSDGDTSLGIYFQKDY